MQLTNYGENKIADFMRGQPAGLPTTWYLALGNAASDSAFTELTGTGYARAPVPLSLNSFSGTQGPGTLVASTGTSHVTSNNAPISWGNPGSAWGTATFVGFFDAATAGNCWIWVPIAAIAITVGAPNPVQVDTNVIGLAVGLTSGCSDYLANKLVDLLFRGQSFVWPATTYLAAFSTATTNNGGGTEVNAGGYARQPIASTLAAWGGTSAPTSTVASSGTDGRISNNAAITFGAPTADWTVAYAALKDALTAGNTLFHGPCAAVRTLLAGGPALSFAANTIGITLA